VGLIYSIRNGHDTR